MSATITTAPALVKEVEIHCVHAYEKKDKSYETVCVVQGVKSVKLFVFCFCLF